MDKMELYRVLDISEPDEFTYYENMASLLEEDQLIEQNLLDDLLREVDLDHFKMLLQSYFDEFLNRIPDEESDLYFLADTMRRSVTGCEDPESISDAIYHFRKWYVITPSVRDVNTGEEICVRDARYNISAASFLGKKPEYDFRKAFDYDMDGYDVSVRDMIEAADR
ncbi:MAG: hypothetical protein Q4C18_00890 [Eubacteriales bacterium]|nr:hypothetical protein [Eubacteriales bacterium]